MAASREPEGCDDCVISATSANTSDPCNDNGDGPVTIIGVPRYSTSQRVKAAYVIDERTILTCERLFVEALSRGTLPPYASTGELTLDVDLSDSKLEGVSISELLELSNIGRQHIRAVRMRSNYHSSPKFDIDFESDGYRAGINYRIDGERDDAEHVEAEIEQIIARARQWYSHLAFVDLVGLLLGAALFAWLAFSLIYFILALAGKVSEEPSSPRDSALAQGFAIVLVVILAAIGALGNKFRRWLFPVAIFALGEEGDRPRKLSAWRWFLGGTVVVGFIVNLAAGIALR